MKHTGISTFVCCIFVLLAVQAASAQPIPGTSGESFRQEGIASWYGTQFDGRPTASGEIFDSTQFTAAHPTLPFGTLLLVTNRNNNRQVSVRVNDRGPFVAGRIVDVSHAAAEYLGMVATGTAPVVIETTPGPGQAQPQPQPRPTAQVQVPPPPPQPAPPVQPQPASPPAPAGVQGPVFVGTTTIPLETQPTAPITINIFHTPDFSQPPTVIVSATPEEEPVLPPPAQAAPQPQTAWPAPAQPQPQPKANDVSQLQSQAAAQLQLAPEARPPQPSPEARALPVLEANPNYTYRIQVGSFRVARNAVDTFVKLKEANFEPAYERHDDFFRVVLTRVPGSEIQPVLDRLAALGFRGASVTME